MAGGFGKPKDDDEIVVDGLGDVDENPWYIPKGEHAASVTLVEKGTSKEGNPKTVFTFSITAGEAKGKDIKIHLSHSEKALWKLKQVLKALGFDTTGKSLKFKTKECVGRKCVLVIEDNEFNGEMRSNVKTVKPPAGA